MDPVKFLIKTVRPSINNNNVSYSDRFTQQRELRHFAQIQYINDLSRLEHEMKQLSLSYGQTKN